MAEELPPAVWSYILRQLTFKEASQAARTCRLWNNELQLRHVVDLRDCKRLFAARECLCRHRRDAKRHLILPASHSAQQALGEVRWGYRKVQLCGLGIVLESLPCSLSFHLMVLQDLQHLELNNMAFTSYTQAPNGDGLEDWYTFNVTCLGVAELKSLVLHFDRILDPCESHHVTQGGWVQGLEECQASSVTVVSTCGKPVRVRIPHPVVKLHIVVDGDLYLERPKGDKYKPTFFDGNDVPEADAVKVCNLCILAASVPQAKIPFTRTRQVYGIDSVGVESWRGLISSNTTPDRHYVAMLERWAPGYSDLAHAVELPSVDWCVSGSRWRKRIPPYSSWC